MSAPERRMGEAALRSLHTQRARDILDVRLQQLSESVADGQVELATARRCHEAMVTYLFGLDEDERRGVAIDERLVVQTRDGKPLANIFAMKPMRLPQGARAHTSPYEYPAEPDEELLRWPT